MPKQILIYSEVFSHSAADFMTSLAEAEGEDIEVRIASDGGEPDFIFGMAAKFNEHTAGKQIKVDGMAHSSLLFFLAFVDVPVEALDVSEFLFHRAAFAEWIEASEHLFTEERKNDVIRMNEKLMKALAAKIDVAKFEALKQVKSKGIKFKDIFSIDDRINVMLSAADAKKIGLISKINKITPTKRAEIKSTQAVLSAKYTGVKMAATIEENNNPNPINQPKNTFKAMTIEKLKAENPSLYNEIFNNGVKTGVSKEKGRVEALLVYQEIDPKLVKEKIEAGDDLSPKMMAEFALKAVSAEKLKAVGHDSANTQETTAEEKVILTAKQKNEEAFKGDVDKLLGIGKKG